MHLFKFAISGTKENKNFTATVKAKATTLFAAQEDIKDVLRARGCCVTHIELLHMRRIRKAAVMRHRS